MDGIHGLEFVVVRVPEQKEAATVNCIAEAQ
jgi:hypothetical protein